VNKKNQDGGGVGALDENIADGLIQLRNQFVLTAFYG
jgi:hypothetical protein